MDTQDNRDKDMPKVPFFEVGQMKIQSCVEHKFSRTTTFRTALTFELLCFVLDALRDGAKRKRDVRKLFYMKYGILIDVIQIRSAFSYLTQKKYIDLRMWGWAEETDKSLVEETCGKTNIYFLINPTQNMSKLKLKLKKEMADDKSLTNCLSYSYLSHESLN